MDHKQQQGYALLAGVLIITAVLLALGLGLNERIRATDVDRGYVTSRINADAIARSCLEEGLLRYTRDATFRSGDLNIPPGLCTITVSPSSGGATITAFAKIGDISRQMSVDCKQQGAHCMPIQFRDQ